VRDAGQIFIGRQPILDRPERIVAYEGAFLAIIM
jgi:c-di-GMP-related signal transduction protein